MLLSCEKEKRNDHNLSEEHLRHLDHDKTLSNFLKAYIGKSNEIESLTDFITEDSNQPTSNVTQNESTEEENLKSVAMKNEAKFMEALEEIDEIIDIMQQESKLTQNKSTEDNIIKRLEITNEYQSMEEIEVTFLIDSKTEYLKEPEFTDSLREPKTGCLIENEIRKEPELTDTVKEIELLTKSIYELKEAVKIAVLIEKANISGNPEPEFTKSLKKSICELKQAIRVAKSLKETITLESLNNPEITESLDNIAGTFRELELAQSFKPQTSEVSNSVENENIGCTLIPIIMKPFTDTHISDKRKKKIKRKYYKNLKREFFATDSTHLVHPHPRDLEFVNITTISKDILMVHEDNYHGFYTLRDHIQCRVCRILVEDKEEHKLDIKHMVNISNVIRDKHCLRLISEIWYHCVLCNDIIESPEVHITCDENHAQLLQVADVTPRKRRKNENIVNNNNKFIKIVNEDNVFNNPVLICRNSEIFCLICKLIFNDTPTIQKHLIEDEHNDKFKKLLLENYVQEKRNNFSCEPCLVRLSDKYLLDHIRCWSHKEKLYNYKSKMETKQIAKIVKDWGAVEDPTFGENILPNAHGSGHKTSGADLGRCSDDDEYNVRSITVYNCNVTNQAKSMLMNVDKNKDIDEIKTDIAIANKLDDTTTKAKLEPNSNLIQQSDEEFVCNICKFIIPKDRVDFHLNGLMHSFNFNSVLTSNNIKENKDTLYCECCDQSMNTNALYNHINLDIHKDNMKIYFTEFKTRSASDVNDITNKTSFTGQSLTKSGSNNSLPCTKNFVAQSKSRSASVVTDKTKESNVPNVNKTSCTDANNITNINRIPEVNPTKNSSGSQCIEKLATEVKTDSVAVVNDLTKENRRLDSSTTETNSLVNIYLIDNDIFCHDNKYKNFLRCKICKIMISNCAARLQRHVKEIKHDSVYKHMLLGMHFIKAFNTNDVKCCACNTTVSNKSYMIKDHLLGKKHNKKFIGFLKANQIDSFNSDVNLCNCCSETFIAADIIQHIESKNHKEKLTKSCAIPHTTSNVELADQSSNSFKPDAPTDVDKANIRSVAKCNVEFSAKCSNSFNSDKTVEVEKPNITSAAKLNMALSIKCSNSFKPGATIEVDKPNITSTAKCDVALSAKCSNSLGAGATIEVDKPNITSAAKSHAELLPKYSFSFKHDAAAEVDVDITSATKYFIPSNHPVKYKDFTQIADNLSYMISPPYSSGKIECVICLQMFADLPNTILSHFNTSKHGFRYQRILSLNKIKVKTDKLRCQFCGVDVEFTKELDHIADMAHTFKRGMLNWNKHVVAKFDATNIKLYVESKNLKENFLKSCASRTKSEVAGYSNNPSTITEVDNTEITTTNKYISCVHPIKYKDFAQISDNLGYMMIPQFAGRIDCAICLQTFADLPNTILEHFNGSSHTFKYQTLLSLNKMRRKANALYCRFCQIDVEFTKELDHIYNVVHNSRKYDVVNENTSVADVPNET